MKIFHIHSGIGYGGASKIAEQINMLLHERKIDSHLLVNSIKYKTYDKKLIYKFPRKFFMRNKLFRYIALGFDQLLGLQDIFFCNYRYYSALPAYKQADIVHFHNLHAYFFNIFEIRKIAKDGKKIIWTFHDEQPYTGKCPVTMGCEKRKTGCGACPNKLQHPRMFLDTSGIFWKKKKALYGSLDFVIASPSKWIYDRAKMAPLCTGKKVYLTENGIDTSVFKKYDKISVRKELGLPLDKKILLFIAPGGKKNVWKGSEIIEKLLTEYRDSDTILLSVGNAEASTVGNIMYYPYIQDPNKLAKIYSAADVFLYPSLADSFGLVVAEAVSCGVPVATFKTGGIPEIVEHKRNGYVAKQGDYHDLSTGVQYLLDNVDTMEISLDKKFTLNAMIERYVQVYRELLKS